MIAEFTGHYRFLSNFWSCFIWYGGVRYPSVENAYQAAKCKHKSDQPKFQGIKASEAKKLGRIVEMRPDWEVEKVQVMRELVLQKFQEPVLKTLLLQTDNEELQEGNWWGDTFWGTVNGKGDNILGKILMSVREELRK